MRELEYPFDGDYLLKKKKSLRRALLGDGSRRIKKKIAVLGGSTTHDIVIMLELFLLNQGLEPEFYESQYNQFFEDAVFGNEALTAFTPDLVYIHTTSRNVPEQLFPNVNDTAEQIQEKQDTVYGRFEQAWEGIRRQFGCTVIQNNFEPPAYRLLGNLDAWDMRGRSAFLSRLNQRFYQYANSHEDFLIQDIAWLAADYGLGRWSDPLYWHMYKYSPAVPAIPALAFNLANMIKAVYGKSKKALVLDLDNTLWGGVVGDDGPENIEIGQETGMGQIYQEFQRYLYAHKERGILLTVDSKNEEENALAGLNRPDSILHPEDFVSIQANWNPKDQNLRQIAADLNIGTDSLVFVDDNPAERFRVSEQVPEASVPEMTKGQEPQPEHYIRILDHSGYFEPVRLSGDDLKRSAMYQANALRRHAQSAFADYGAYLDSLKMQARIAPYAPEYMQRIAQLTNKSNQFNLTTKRCSQADMERFAADEAYLDLYGKLTDKFGDNGVVTVVLGRQQEDTLHLELWLMSCRVLKRGMEQAMLDMVVRQSLARGVARIRGYYYPTAKNGMVREFYREMGFELISQKEDGSTVWELSTKDYQPQNRHIAVNNE